MQILLLSYEYPPLGGGGGVAAAHYARAWACQGHRVAVVTSNTAGLPTYTLDGDVEVYRLPVPWRNAQATASFPSLLAFPFMAVRFARRRWSAQSFDVINSFFAVPSGVAGAWLARGWRLPHIVTVIGGDVYDPSKRLSPHRTPGLKQIVTTVLASAAQVIAESQDVARRAEQFYRLARPVTIIPFGIELPPQVTTPRHEDQPIVIVALARLVRRKLLDCLIQAYARLPKGLVRLVIAGEGPERAALEQMIADLGIADRVELRGYVSGAEKLAVLSEADIFALVSEHEGFCLAYLEAAAQHLPIIAGTVGGQLDFLEHGRTGWLVPPGDVAGLTRALASLATQPELRRWMGLNALTVARRYQIADVANAYIEVFYDAQHALDTVVDRTV